MRRELLPRFLPRAAPSADPGQQVVRVLHCSQYTNDYSDENRSRIVPPSIHERLSPARTVRAAQAQPCPRQSGCRKRASFIPSALKLTVQPSFAQRITPTARTKRLAAGQAELKTRSLGQRRSFNLPDTRATTITATSRQCRGLEPRSDFYEMEYSLYTGSFTDEFFSEVSVLVE